jgi:hypothetical protein
MAVASYTYDALAAEVRNDLPDAPGSPRHWTGPKVGKTDDRSGAGAAGLPDGPGGEFVAEELIVQVIPRAEDEFTCYSRFLVRHRSQEAREKDGHPYCIECDD